MAAYMDNGTLDILNVQYRLENGFVVNGMKLVPLAFIVSVDEPERSSADTIVFEKVHALTMKGQKVWLLGKEDLEISGIYNSAVPRWLSCWQNLLQSS